MQAIIDKLLTEKITIYEAVDLVKLSPNRYLRDLRNILVAHKVSFIRLFAAWSLGESKDKKSFNLLLSCYDREKEPNARANIVRALMFIAPNKIPLNYIKKFLEDNYSFIPLFAIKFLPFNNNVQYKLNFLDYYPLFTELTLKIEMLRNLRFFSYNPEQVVEFLSSELKVATFNPIFAMELIKSIGKANSPKSIFFLMNYYGKNKRKFMQSDFLSFGFASAIVELSQSKAYKILHELYNNNPELLVRWKILEAISSFGGPNALKMLNEIRSKENDVILKKTIEYQIKNIIITTIK